MTWTKNYKKKGESKYHNQPVVYDGITFDSIHEKQRWCFLKLMERAGKISNLRFHVPFTLIPKGAVALLRMPDGKEVEIQKFDRKRYYEADFVYINKKGEEIVEDFKGFETETFKQKRILFNIIYGKDIKIVKQINEDIY